MLTPTNFPCVTLHFRLQVALDSSEPLIPRGHLEYCEVSGLRQLIFGLNQKNFQIASVVALKKQFLYRFRWFEGKMTVFWPSL